MHSRVITPLAALALALAASLVAAISPVAASTHDATTVTLGWQTEAADEIVVGFVVPGSEGAARPEMGDVEFRVDRPIKGELTAGASVRIRLDGHGRDTPWRAGLAHLVFLRRGDAKSGVPQIHVPVSGDFSVRALPAGSAEERFPALVATLRETLDAKDAAALRSLLVTWMEDADPGVAWSAATDFVRHRELAAALPESESARIVAAFRRQPLGKATKGALALAVAATRSADAAPALVEALLVPGASSIRAVVGEALRRLDDPAGPSLVATRLADATAAQRPVLLGALAVAGGAPEAPAVRPLLADADATVRAEAAAALGSLARNARARDADARLGVARALTERLQRAAELPEDEIRALLWALAQLDEPGAFDAVRAAAADETLPAPVRDWAASLAARPRQSLVPRN